METLLPDRPPALREFVSDVQAFAKAKGWSVATVTDKACGNSKLIQRILDGGSCTFDQAAKVRDFMENNPPPNPGVPPAGDAPAGPAPSLGDTPAAPPHPGGGGDSEERAA